MYKNQLQELAQRSCFNLPAYSCVREGPDHSPRFKAKVNFNGEIFESPSFCSNLRQAEHAAAEVALKSLSQRGPSRALAARVLDETGIYKNLLQETAHRAGLKLPVYTTVRTGPAYAPVFTCTVEITGMTFAGEPAKTKKQAQKSAALAAWFALKNLALQDGCSSASGLDGKDEQEQATVARYLSRLKLPETRKSASKERCPVKQEHSYVRRDMTQYDAGRSFYEMQHRTLVYPNFLPEVAIYPSWNQQVFQQQRLQFFPFAPSVFRPETGLYSFARAQERATLVPEFSPVFYFSHDTVPRPIGINSQVTIEEIEEKVQGEQTQAINEAYSAQCQWRASSPSNVSFMPTEVPGYQESFSINPRLRMEEFQQDKCELNKGRSVNDTRNCNQPEASPKECNQVSSESVPNRSRDMLEVRHHLSSSVRLPYNAVASSSRSSRGPLAYPPRATLTAATAEGRFLTSFIPEGSSTSLPASASASRNAIYPYLRPASFSGVKKFRGTSHTSSMVPAVQIRSVVPVCSAPPAKENSTKDQEEKARETQSEFSAASSEFCRLQI